MGLKELLSTASVPKGSFYHYFSSKEDFGCALLERYLTQNLKKLNKELGTDGPDAKARLMHYWSLWAMTQAAGDVRSQCLIVKIGAEVSDISSEMRAIIDDGTHRITDRLSHAIAEGQADGSICMTVKTVLLGPALYEMWLGATLMAKLTNARDPFDRALRTTEQLLAKPAGPSR